MSLQLRTSRLAAANRRENAGSIGCRFERQVKSRPNQVALVSDHGQWSYAELDAAVAWLAADLRRHQVGAGDVAVVLCDRSVEFVASALGIIRAGAVFLPLDPQYPDDRIISMLDDVSPAVVVHQPQFEDLARRGGHWQHIEVGPSQFRATASHSKAMPTIGDRQAAYAVFTSGSTGRPKAALLTHGGLANLINVQQAAFRVEPSSRVLQFASPAFDASISEIFVTLAAGATLVVPNVWQSVPGKPLVQTLRQKRVTHLTVPPTLLGEMPIAELPDLRTLVVAGEACSAEIASRWSRGRRFINAYGPTEATVCTTMYQCPEGDQPRPPIGLPIANCWTYVLDDQGERCGDGVVGELCIGGVGVGLGYLNRPGLTAERFVRDPFRPNGATMYRSGDLVRQRSDGNLEYVGRVDQQLKIRGVRIEPAETAAALEALPSVWQAAVVAEEAEGSPRLVAFATPAGSNPPKPRSLIAELRHQLPLHLVPARLEWVSAFPRHPSGKIDLGALQAVTVTEPNADNICQANPSSPLENEVLQIARQVLQKQSFGVQDDFFAWGGDSLAAMDLLGRIEHRFGKKLEPRELLASPTPAALTRALHLTRTSRLHPLVVPLSDECGGPRLYCIHPGGGNVYCYLELARALGAEMSVCGIQSHGIEDDLPPQKTVEVLAEEYLEAIRTTTGHREFFLCGWSFGGIVAFEMAKRLAEDNYAPPVILIDTGRLHAFSIVQALFPDINVPFFQIPWLSEEELFGSFCGQNGNSELIPAGADRQLSKRIFHVFMANVEATLRYQPDRVDADLVFIEAEQPLPGMRRRPSEEWKDRCRNLHVFRTQGSHLQLVHDPYVKSLARILKNVCRK